MTTFELCVWLSQSPPVIAGAIARRRLTTARRWVVAWGLYSVLGTAAQMIFAHPGSSNLWLTYILAPIDVSLALYALSCFSVRPVARSALRWAVVVALAIHVAALLLLENRTGYSIVGVPSYALIAFAAALTTFVMLALDETEAMVRQDWFWIAGGYAIYYAALAVVQPLSAVLLTADRGTLRIVVTVFLVVNAASYLAVAAGLLMPAARSTVNVPAGR